MHRYIPLILKRKLCIIRAISSFLINFIGLMSNATGLAKRFLWIQERVDFAHVGHAKTTIEKKSALY